MINDQNAWDAVVRRDRELDGRFVFAVSSTGIYCRPSCPSRRPRRENVRFFEANDEAERAGFRACRRCLPDSATTPLAERVRAILDKSEEITLAVLARRTGVTPHHLQRTFKARFGVSPKEYLAARRAERLKAQLKEGKDVTTATYEAGYGSSSRLYSESNDRLGMTPGTYRDGGRGMHVRYAVASTSVGTLLVAVTDRGVCAVSLGDSEAVLARALRDELPKATIEKTADSEALRALVEQVERGTPAALPLDVRASAFQIRVWNALRKIPYGETRTYSEVAEAIGAPRSARAVASACARNRVALIVPCHRVVRGDGESGGYRWGAKRKAAILQRERGKR